MVSTTNKKIIEARLVGICCLYTSLFTTILHVSRFSLPTSNSLFKQIKHNFSRKLAALPVKNNSSALSLEQR